MNTATVQSAGERAVLRFERHLSKSPKEVWRALTDRDELNQWFPDDVDTDWSVGAPIVFTFRNNEMEPMTGTVLEVDEPHVLSFTWGPETLRFELTPAADGGTDLVLTDELERGHAARNAAGWDVCLDALEGRAGSEWKPRFDQYVSRFEPDLGPQEGPPPGF